jgi:hypothetical protein
MNTLPSHDPVLTEHTFGRDHFSPPPLALEQSASEAQFAGAGGMPLDLDLDQRIRNVGEW